MKRMLIVFVALSLVVAPGFAIDVTINTYSDAGHTKPSYFFGNSSYVYFTAYNGVSCCDVKAAFLTIVDADGNTVSISNVTMNDNQSNGVYSGYFKIGSNIANDSLLVGDGQRVRIDISLTPLSSGVKDVEAKYSAPQGVVLFGIFDNGVVLNWSYAEDPSGIDHYIVYRSVQSIASDASAATTFVSYTTQFVDKDMVDGRTYFYAVAAVDKVGNIGVLSNNVELNIPDATKPYVIDKFQAFAVKAGSVKLAWSEPYDNVGIDHYVVYKSDNEITNDTLEYITTGDTSYIDTNTSDGRKYYYAISAVDRAGNFGNVSKSLFVYADSLGPVKVSDLKAELGKNGLVALSWSAVKDTNNDNNAHVYRIYHSRMEIKSKADVDTIEPVVITENTSFSEVRDGLTYYAVVSVDDAGNDGDISNIVSIAPDITAPEPVIDLKIESSDNRMIILTWKASTSMDISGYYIYRSVENSSIESLVLYTKADSIAFNDTGVEQGKTYYYVVRAVDNAGNEDSNINMVSIDARDSVIELDALYPKNNSEVSQDKITVLGRSDSDATIEVKTTINSIAFTSDAIVDKNGLFISYIPLAYGLNKLEVSAVDSAGNKRSMDIIVVNKLNKTASSDDINSALSDASENLVNETFSLSVVDALMKNDENIGKERGSVENFITGASVMNIINFPLIGLILAVVGIGFTVFYNRFLRKEFTAVKNTFSTKLKDEEEKRVAVEKDLEQEKNEKEHLRKSLEKYLSPDIAQRIVKNPGLKNEKKELTMLFVDIRGFFNLCEQIGEENVVPILDQYFDRMTKIVYNNKGTVDKFIGDMVMAIFGLEDGHDHSYNAVKSAVEMQKEIAKLNGYLKSHGKNPISVGISLSTGNVIIGNLGNEHIEFTAIGEPVNVAWRLEEIAKAGEIVISESTYNKVKGKVRLKGKQTVSIKGKTHPINVYKVFDLV